MHSAVCRASCTVPSPSTPHPLHTSYVLGPYTPQSLITPRHAYAAAAVLPRTQEEPFASITPLACSNQSGVYKWLETMVTHHVGGVTQVGEAGAAAAGTTGQAGANAAPAASGGASGMVAPLEEGQGAHTILDELPPGCLPCLPCLAILFQTLHHRPPQCRAAPLSPCPLPLAQQACQQALLAAERPLPRRCRQVVQVVRRASHRLSSTFQHCGMRARARPLSVAWHMQSLLKAMRQWRGPSRPAHQRTHDQWT